jgi:hypothetical protein
MKGVAFSGVLAALVCGAGIRNSSYEVDGFRIHAAGRLKKTIYIRLERSQG